MTAFPRIKNCDDLRVGLHLREEMLSGRSLSSWSCALLSLHSSAVPSGSAVCCAHERPCFWCQHKQSYFKCLCPWSVRHSPSVCNDVYLLVRFFQLGQKSELHALIHYNNMLIWLRWSVGFLTKNEINLSLTEAGYERNEMALSGLAALESRRNFPLSN